MWEVMTQPQHDDSVEDAADVPEEDDNQVDNEEEWEKGVPPFVKKLTKMVSENKSIQTIKVPLHLPPKTVVRV